MRVRRQLQLHDRGVLHLENDYGFVRSGSSEFFVESYSQYPNEATRTYFSFSLQGDPPCLIVLNTPANVSLFPPIDDYRETCVEFRVNRWIAVKKPGTHRRRLSSGIQRAIRDDQALYMQVVSNSEPDYGRLVLAVFQKNPGNSMDEIEVHVRHMRLADLRIFVCIASVVLALFVIALDGRICRGLWSRTTKEKEWIFSAYPVEKFGDIAREIGGIVNGADETAVARFTPSTSLEALACAVCQEKFGCHDRVCCVAECRHVYHATCLFRWIWANGKRCPLQDVDPAHPR
eukprot:Polyplicarium_translucidae@DN2436_c1_g1_i1.p1